MGAVPLDPFAFRASARLDLGLVAACLPEKIVKSSVRFVAAEDRDQDIFQAPDNECTVGLVAELVALSCCLLDLNIRMGLREGGKVGIKEIYIELLLDGDRSSAVKLLQKQLVLQLVILEFQVPSHKIELFKILSGIRFVKQVGGKVFRSAVAEVDGKDTDRTVVPVTVNAMCLDCE